MSVVVTSSLPARPAAWRSPTRWSTVKSAGPASVSVLPSARAAAWTAMSSAVPPGSRAPAVMLVSFDPAVMSIVPVPAMSGVVGWRFAAGAGDVGGGDVELAGEARCMEIADQVVDGEVRRARKRQRLAVGKGCGVDHDVIGRAAGQ